MSQYEITQEQWIVDNASNKQVRHSTAAGVFIWTVWIEKMDRNRRAMKYKSNILSLTHSFTHKLTHTHTHTHQHTQADKDSTGWLRQKFVVTWFCNLTETCICRTNLLVLPSLVCVCVCVCVYVCVCVWRGLLTKCQWSSHWKSSPNL
jgi:predicted 3-demethylubiquinone-9 3-methyltransferase (glyoxalase superfamily)